MKHTGIGTAAELQTIPGVGPAIARDLMALGITAIADLKHRDPQKLYERLCALRKTHVDRCVLYVFRCAVYFASHKHPKARLLRWWAWKG